MAPLVHECRPRIARCTVRRIIGSPALGGEQLDEDSPCKSCGLCSTTPEAMERHTVHCPMGASRHTLHSGLMKQLVVILKAAGVHPDRIRIEMRGLRASDRSRPGDVVVLDFYGPDHHLVIDDAATSIYRNAVLV